MKTAYDVTGHSHSGADAGQRRLRVVFDGGNRFVKWLDPPDFSRDVEKGDLFASCSGEQTLWLVDFR